VRPTADTPPRPRRRSVLLLPAVWALTAPVWAQTLTPTARNGSIFVGCGSVFDGPRLTHTFSTPVDVHDPISVSDDGGGFIPVSSASSRLDAAATPTAISLSIVGDSMRGDIPPGGSGAAYANATGSDQWSFTVAQTACFTLDVSVGVSLSTGGPVAAQGVQLGTANGSRLITLSDGTHTNLVSVFLQAPGSAAQHFAGSLAPGSYFMTISGQADGNGAPRSASYNTSASLTLGPPATPGSPADAAACSGRGAAFSIPAIPGATYEWQLETAPNVWQGLGADPAPLPCGGRAYATPANSPAVQIGVEPCQGVASYQVRCLVTSFCGAAASPSATLTINSADFNGDGDVGTDADIEAFFACLAGNCCPTCGSADFNGDGDVGTDADIEAFFRVLAGGNC
jgi:hypothetical protein